MNIKDLRQGAGYSNVDIFTYEELGFATKHFRPDLILGEVYNGVIDDSVRSGYKSLKSPLRSLIAKDFKTIANGSEPLPHSLQEGSQHI